eukprot:741001_1
MQCQGLLEVIEEEDKKNNIQHDNDIIAPKQSLTVYNQLVEKANMNLEDASVSLQRDDDRVIQLMQQMQKMQTKIADQKLKRVQDKFEKIKTGTEIFPPPDLLELQDLRKKINALYQKAEDDMKWLGSSMKTLEKQNKKATKVSKKSR